MALKILTIEDGTITFNKDGNKYKYYNRGNVLLSVPKCEKCKRLLRSGIRMIKNTTVLNVMCLKCFMKDKIVTRKELNYMRTLAELE